MYIATIRAIKASIITPSVTASFLCIKGERIFPLFTFLSLSVFWDVLILSYILAFSLIIYYGLTVISINHT